MALEDRDHISFDVFDIVGAVIVHKQVQFPLYRKLRLHQPIHGGG